MYTVFAEHQTKRTKKLDLSHDKSRIGANNLQN